MTPSKNDRPGPGEPMASGDRALPDTEPHANIVHHREHGPHSGTESRGETPAEGKVRAAVKAHRDDDPGLAAGGSRQETALHGRPATGGGSNEFARKPDTSHHDP